MMGTDLYSPSEIREILRMKNVAVVGMSNTDGKPANFLPKYLIENGYNVIPVNPTTKEVGRKSYASVSEISEQVDIVDVFRRSEDVPPVVDDATKKKGIKVIWMRSGIYNNADAERKAKENGIDVVYNRCMKVEHRCSLIKISKTSPIFLFSNRRTW